MNLTVKEDQTVLNLTNQLKTTHTPKLKFKK